MVHEELRLYISDNSYLLEPVYNDPSVQTECLMVDRVAGGLRLNVPAPPVPSQQEVLVIYGIMGFIRLQAGEYMIVITNKEKIGKISGHDIYRVTSFQILPLPKDLMSLSDKQTADEQTFISLLESHLKSNAFYYSYTYDITQALQRSIQLNSSRKLWQRADNRFFWNRFISSKMIDLTEKSYDQDLSNFILPVMQGYICPTHINNKNFVFILISRRSRFRAGTRFFSRGIDSNGNVSNFVETEQLVLHDPLRDGELPQKQIEGRIQLSYVQTRGSVPINWAQIANLKYMPALKVMDSSSIPTRKHFDEQLEIYGSQVLVNLVNTSGYEVPVGQGYGRTVSQLNDHRLRYIHFDFHKECKNMQWHRINILLDQINDDLDRAIYCKYDAVTARSHKLQQGVVRTSCMDCLDRTNVVQSTLARVVLNKQLRELRILSEREEIDEHLEFINLFRNVWADNADAVSLSYSGTGAMKTDFTRTGKRTKAGAFQDFVNGATRYFKNNYFDGVRQDAFDLILGNYQVTTGIPSPFTTHTALHFRVVPLILIFALVMLAAGLLVPSAVGVSSQPSWFYVLFWIGVLVSTLRFVFQNGAEFVDWPKLVPLSFVSEKESNGFSSFHISVGGRKEDELERRERGEDIPLKKIT